MIGGCCAVSIVVRVVTDLVGCVALAFRSRQSLQAEVLFLRRQLAMYVEPGVKPRRIDAATRVSLVLLSRLFEWRSALIAVRSRGPSRSQTGGHDSVGDNRSSRKLPFTDVKPAICPRSHGADAGLSSTELYCNLSTPPHFTGAEFSIHHDGVGRMYQRRQRVRFRSEAPIIHSSARSLRYSTANAAHRLAELPRVSSLQPRSS
jgi:hypothetical protein